MLKIFYPYRYYDSAYSIDFEELKSQGLKGVIFDVDNTLVEHNAPVDDRARNMFSSLHAMGIETCIVSNNKEARVEPLARLCGSKYVSKANKPSKKGYLKALEIMDCDADSAVLVGDQLFTDVWGANRAGIRSMLVKPIDSHEEIQIVLKRILERPIIRLYKKKAKKTEEYYQLWT